MLSDLRSGKLNVNFTWPKSQACYLLQDYNTGEPLVVKFSVILQLLGIASIQLFYILELLMAQHPENAFSDPFLAAFLKSDPERCLIHHCPKREAPGSSRELHVCFPPSLVHLDKSFFICNN